MTLLEKIRTKKAAVGVIGLGYVGLPLVREFCRQGFKVTGFDIDPEKITLLKAGKSYIKHIGHKTVRELGTGFHPTTNFGLLKKMDCTIVCVPTPLGTNREPDLKYIRMTTEAIAKCLHKGQLVILESTTYPGTTDGMMREVLEATGLTAGRDFHLAFSPEREDPNNPDFSTSNIPKVVGGLTPACLKAACALYDHIISATVPVSSTRAAEATKLLENIYRSVNIALVNELKVIFDQMDIDVWEVIDAAKTKPFGFQAFYPGPGLGGHCIPIDPFYLTWKAREYEMGAKFIELAGEINTAMPRYVVEKILEALSDRGKAMKNARILILGLAYKKDIDDIRESASFKLIELLAERGAKVDYNDPHVPKTHKMRQYHYKMTSVPLTERNLKKYDAVVIATDHSAYDFTFIVKNAQLVIDTRNATKGIKRKNIVKA